MSDPPKITDADLRRAAQDSDYLAELIKRVRKVRREGAARPALSVRPEPTHRARKGSVGAPAEVTVCCPSCDAVQTRPITQAERFRLARVWHVGPFPVTCRDCRVEFLILIGVEARATSYSRDRRRAKAVKSKTKSKTKGGSDE